MQFLKTFLVLLFATLISAAAFPQDTEAVGDETVGTDTVAADFTGVRTRKSADGKQYTFLVYEAGRLDTTFVVVDDPAAPELTFSAFNANGAKFDGASLDAAGAAASAEGLSAEGAALLCNRACIIWRFIRRYGRRALRFIACLGNRLPTRCWISILSCMLSRDPWTCFAGILCSTGIIRRCIRV
ncbi:hypothetical protein L873DRAFT_1807764 [Choiromyces venosus 120613-1]|uniref:Uncharacterized protein n=1 Tax=Choiromyces venosus 120613-1 TaxID=1336337 RepID=A0A3N4JKK3_9PEZI|nr:hypothetical protein L873DRAFT_1807764 [Choiromyces venosus 120613-1]